MKDSLLSHIASKFIPQYENAADSSICYLLNKYAPAREALKEALRIKEIPTHYTSEDSTEESGRPDITGKDLGGKIIVMVEGKFWANLTDNQPVNYLKELDEHGKLLFLVPHQRIESIKIDIKNRLDRDDERIVIRSWGEFLDLIGSENNEKYDPELAGDLLQLKQLCSKMEEEGMAPLSMSDLDPMNGRLMYNFLSLIDKCNPIMRQWGKANFKGLQTSAGKDYYGFYFTAFNLTCLLAFSSYDWFSKDSHTPIWLYIQDNKWKKSEKIYHFLNSFDSNNSYDDDDCSSYGIVLKNGMDETQTINHIVNITKEVLEFLSGKINKNE